MALAERVGFVREGVMREYSRFDGEYVDEHVFAILRSDWAAGRDHPGRARPQH
jgi:RimJ/RimL family protein N-acetyltransferase